MCDQSESPESLELAIVDQLTTKKCCRPIFIKNSDP